MRLWKRGALIASTALACAACSDDSPSAQTTAPEDGSVPSNGGAAANGGATGNGGATAGGSSNGGASGTGTGGTTGGAGGSAGASGGGAGGVDPSAGGVVGVGGTYVWTGEVPAELATPKLDLLLVVDNSNGMADHQRVLESSVADLLRVVTNAATKVIDLHVGVITSSIGGHGGDICNGTSEQLDDHAHLLGTRPRAQSLGLTSGFASWTGGSADTLITNVTGLVRAAGENGCGFEAPLESLYRFLADPEPPLSVTLAPCPSVPSAMCATRTGTDTELLAERAAFLRPDSELAVVLHTNEDDCSIRDGSQYYFVAQSQAPLPGGSSACASNPNDPCCYSCGTGVPAGCTADPACQQPWTFATDPPNLRCFDERRRYGIDFLYPVQRYVNALSKPTLCAANVDLNATACAAGAVTNPLFTGTRTASMVHLLGVVGVPWQTIAKSSGTNALVYKTGAELGTGDFTTIYGEPTASPPVPPTDPLMIGSITPRTGTTPGTGEALAPPSAGYLANSVNGHEWTNSGRNDLQYACIFPLVPPKDCTSNTGSCECDVGENDQSPLCQAGDGTYGPVQRFAKAYPGSRHIALVRDLGASATLASICPKQMRDPTQADYAYRPAMNVLLRALAK